MFHMKMQGEGTQIKSFADATFSTGFCRIEVKTRKKFMLKICMYIGPVAEFVLLLLDVKCILHEFLPHKYNSFGNAQDKKIRISYQQI